MIRLGIRILPKKEVLDSQGKATLRVIRKIKEETNLTSIHVGKFIVLDFDTQTQEEALEEAKELCESLLSHPLVETYKIEIL